MKIIQKYFNQLSELQISQFMMLESLYADWNAKINVISRKDIESLYERHVLHSLSIAKLVTFKPGTRILDIGTGGGFPGIPLAILFPETDFLLIDSIGKKIKVVNGVIDVLGLKNTTAQHRHSNDVKEKYDFIISRAVTSFPKFIQIAKGKFRDRSLNSIRNGIIYLKGGDLAEELENFKKKVALYPISKYFEEPFFETKYLVYFPWN